MARTIDSVPAARFPLSGHVQNVADNLQLVADLGYGDVALAVPEGRTLRVVADARPVTAVSAIGTSRVGRVLDESAEREAYEALRTGAPSCGTRRRTARGIAYATAAYPIRSDGALVGVLVRNLAEQVTESPGAMEVAFMGLAERVIRLLSEGPILDVDTGAPFATVRRAGDGIMEIDGSGVVAYASPNAVNIMRLAGSDSAVTGRAATELPGGATAIAPVVHSRGGRAVVIEVAGRVLNYRAIGFDPGALVLVEDITDVRRREQEIRVKEATIREVHHRVKNNLQTVASLLRIQARRASSGEAKRALTEAVDRVASMAVVHEMLAAATEEAVDFTAVARTVVDMVVRGMAAEATARARVEGETGLVPAATATSLALVLAELVHNAIEHGLRAEAGEVTVTLSRTADTLVLSVRDTGPGLPEGFDPGASGNLGLAIVRTVVEEDLRGSLGFSGTRGTTVTVRVPMTAEGGRR
ncbi:sensor histidine kinase [Coriobacteriia bacterium Es71-Z0120]|uniref:sensor histidine kinase n=1 Tax=Parvivirga hydrogeniphila TaxID=2939460 RepID=UPI002260C091|nr:histidine kinase N-terminal domain-containing protein [Parvivirga hydrogeniphila]MCL4078843.1 sensor histidine kinase [Parvivirga hydrogeniphila]